MWYLCALFAYKTRIWEWTALDFFDVRVCLCELLVVSRWVWVVEKQKPVSRWFRGAQHPMVVVLFDFMGVQKRVSRHLILFAICGPAGTQLLALNRQRACSSCKMTSSCHIGGTQFMSAECNWILNMTKVQMFAEKAATTESLPWSWPKYLRDSFFMSQ